MSDTWGLPEMCEIYAKAPKTKQTHHTADKVVVRGEIEETTHTAARHVEGIYCNS